MKMMCKRGLSLFLAIVMIVGIIPMSVFAEDVCEHVNVEYIDEPATCTEAGYYAEICTDCMEYLAQEDRPSYGHDYVDGICTVCGEAEAEPEEDQTSDPQGSEETLLAGPMTYAASREENGVILHGNNIWLDKNREDDLVSSVMMFGLKTMVLDALNTSGDKVYYVNDAGKKYDVANILDLAAAGEELKDVLTGQAALRFQVVKGGSVIKDEYVTLRNIDHLKFDIQIPDVISAGEPEDLKAEIEEKLANAVITVTHNGDVIDHEMISSDLIDIAYNIPENVAWPGLTKSVLSKASITVTIRDSVSLCSTEKNPYPTTTKSATAYLRLVDSTPKYTVQFSDPDGVWKQYTVIDGFSLADQGVTNLVATRKYYDFLGWYVTGDESKTIVENPFSVVMNQDAATSYTALLVPQPGYDLDGNGICDYEQTYTVRYYLEKADAAANNENVYKKFNLRYGSDTQMPANPTKDGEYFVGWLKYTGENGETTGVSQYVEGNVNYYAVWAKTNSVKVTYVKNAEDGTSDDFDLPLNENGKVDDVAPNAFSYTKWYVKDAEGKKVEWNFDTIVTENNPYVKDGVLQLECEVGYDDNNNEKLDGSAEDPIIEYYYQYEENGEWKNYITPQTLFVNDKNAIDRGYNDNRQNDVLIDAEEPWVLNEAYGNGTGKKDIHNDGNYVIEYYRFNTLPDVNNNDVSDYEEKAAIAYDAKKDSIKAAQGDGNSYLKDTGVLTVKSDAGVEMGTVTIPGLKADGTFLANTNGETSGNNAVETVITVAVKPNYYVSEIKVDDKAQELNPNPDGTYTILLNDLQPIKTRANDGHKIEVIFKEIKIEYKDNAAVRAALSAGHKYTAAEVYKAAVAYPAYNEDAVVDVYYVARPAGSATVRIDALRKDIENRYGALGSKMLNKVWPGDTVTVKLDEVIKPVSYEPDGMVMTAQQVVDSYILELQNVDVSELMGALAVLERTVASKVKASADVRPFLYNVEGTEFEETLIATYQDNILTIQNMDNNRSNPFKLDDNRPATEITADSVKNVKVGKYTNDALMAGAYLHLAGSTEKLETEEGIHLAGDFEGCGAREYKGVPIYFAGNEEYKPAVATFNLIVKKSDLTLSIKKAVAVPFNDHSYVADAKATINTGNDDLAGKPVEYISVVAGLDLSNADLDLGKSNPYVNFKNVGTKAWIHIPENLKNLLTMAGIDISGSRTRSLKEIETMFQTNRAMLEQYDVPGWAIDRILQVLNKVNAYAQATLDMEITFVETLEDAYPTAPGVYANMAVTADPRYNTAYGYGAIMIAPVLALPDRGNVQLTYGGENKSVYILPNDLTAKDMVVTYKGAALTGDEAAKAPIYYYGIDSEFRVMEGIGNRNDQGEFVPGLNVPINPGIYLASTLYTKDNNGVMTDMGSDVAILVIGLAEIEMDVVTDLAIPVDGKPHTPEINVTIPDGNGGTVTKGYKEAGVGMTIISGKVNVEHDGDIGLDDLSAEVNIEFPAIIYDKWPAFANKMNNQTEIDLTGMKLDPDMKSSYISPAVLRQFIEWCKTQNTEKYNEEYLKLTVERLKKLHVPAKYIDDVVHYYNKTLDKMIEYCGDLERAAAKLGDNAFLITFDPAKTARTEEGMYFYMGIVTDRDYIPYVNGGIMVLQGDTNILLNTHTPYNGKAQAPSGWNNLEGKTVTLVIDKQTNQWNFISDPSIHALINEAINELEDVAAEYGLKVEVGKHNWLDGKTLGDLYADATPIGDKLVDKICEKIQARLIAKIPSDTIQSEVDILKAGIEKRIVKLNARLDARLKKLCESYGYITFSVNDSLPVNVGTYEFYTFSDTITVSRADLVIEPIYLKLSVNPQNLVKTYDGAKLNEFDVVETYYSYAYVDGENRTESTVIIDKEDLPASIKSALTVSYETKCDGVNVSDTPYPIEIINYSTNTVPNFGGIAIVENGTLKIEPKVVEVTFGGTDGTYTKNYGDADPKFEVDAVDATNPIPSGVTIEIKREGAGTVAGENIGTYKLDIVATGNANYDVQLKTPAQLVIEPAKVDIIVTNKDIAFDEEAKDFEYTYEVKAGLGNKSAEEIKALIDAMVIQIAKGEEVADKPGTYELVVESYVKNPNIDLTITNGELTIGLGDYICWNTVTGMPYTRVNAALKEAKPGETVQMLKDALYDADETKNKAEETIIVYAGTTFDLNGFYVEAGNLLSFGVVMDSMLAETKISIMDKELEPSIVADSVMATINGKVENVEMKSGGVLISNKTTEAWTQLQQANDGYMPIYDTETGSYKFFKGEINSYGSIKDGTDAVIFYYRILFENTEAYSVVENTDDTSFNVILNVAWTGNEDYNVTYATSENLWREHCITQNSSKGYVMYLRVFGLDGINNLEYVSAEPTLNSNTLVHSTAKKMTQNY